MQGIGDQVPDQQADRLRVLRPGRDVFLERAARGRARRRQCDEPARIGQPHVVHEVDQLLRRHDLGAVPQQAEVRIGARAREELLVDRVSGDVGRVVLGARPGEDGLQDAAAHGGGQLHRNPEVVRELLGVQPLQPGQLPGEALAHALGDGPVRLLVPVQTHETRVGLLRDQPPPGTPGDHVVREGEVLGAVPLPEQVRDDRTVVQELREGLAVGRLRLRDEVRVQGLVVDEEGPVDHQGPAVDE
ncbi:hypothetical protein ACFXGT_23900 [Streptomyces sp. NPDC059352]|uniref:hypothetical protein n=1 Tax=Streptomyces sp. NPDC059352 TaxID=3346810 RepID=UPI00369C5B36